MDITAAISGAKTTFELARALQSGLARQQIKPEEVPARLMELQQHILSMQAIVHDLAEENRQLRARLDDNDEHDKLLEDMEYREDGNFWIRKSEADKGLIAYCPACWGAEKKLVAMAPFKHPDVYRCPLHEKTAYTTKVYEEWLRMQPKPGPRVVSRFDNWFR
jgi:hypothetical protein